LTRNWRLIDDRTTPMGSQREKSCYFLLPESLTGRMFY